MSNGPPGIPLDVGDSDYWLALGTMIEAFSRAEGMLFMYLIHATGVNKMVGKAILSGLRADALIKLLRRVWEVTPPDPATKKELDGALVQLAHISDARSGLVHWRSVVMRSQGGRALERISTNRLRAHVESRVRAVRVSPQLLDDMAWDLERISQHLVSLRMHPEMPFHERAAVWELLRAAWRYRPPSAPGMKAPRQKKAGRPRQP